MQQLTLSFEAPQVPDLSIAVAPDLLSYDVILVSTSAGKDSLAMLDLVAERCTELGILDRLVAVHADLGRVEWQGTRELAERQASKYGIRFEVISRPQGDLLTQVEERGMWPSSSARYCTSDHKRGQIQKVITKLSRELGRPSRILNVIGLRAQESDARAEKIPFEHNARASSSKRHVDNWLPILSWTVDQVWDRIRSRGLEYHYAYDLGMERLSCVFCVLAPAAQLQMAAKHNPELLEQYLEVERKIGHDFQNGRSLAETTSLHQIQEAA